MTTNTRTSETILAEMDCVRAALASADVLEAMELATELGSLALELCDLA